VWINLSRLCGFFDRRWGGRFRKDPLAGSPSDPSSSNTSGQPPLRHIKVRISHSWRHEWVQRFSLSDRYSARCPVPWVMEIAEELLNLCWSLRRDLIVGSVATLGMMLVLFNSIDRPDTFVSMPIDGSLPSPLAMEGGDPYIRALMRTISASESNVEYPYSVVYGGEYVRDLRYHPDVCVTIANGPNTGDCSTAAGRYQMLSSTWHEKSELYHPQASGFQLWRSYNFEPEFQDEVVYRWLKDETAWGVDLADLLRQERLAEVLEILSPTWTSLGYGMETNEMTKSLPEIYQQMLKEELAGGGD
jgi:muramidase (phage lysozyme)